MNKKRLFLLIIIFGTLTSCGVYNSLMNLSKLKFKLGSVDNFKVGNLIVTNKSKLSDFSTGDILSLTSKLISGDFPVTFTVNVLAQNPNASDNNSSLTDISLESFPWSLYINDKKTISGNIAKPIKVTAIEKSTVIPLPVRAIEQLPALSFRHTEP